MSVGPLTNRNISPIDLQSWGLSLKPNVKINDPILTNALRNLINGSVLTSKEEKVLTDTFDHIAGDAATIAALKTYLSIEQDNFDDTTGNENLDSFDKKPLQELKPNDIDSLGQKQDNFREEFKAAKERLIKLLGNDEAAKKSPIITEINNVLTSMSGIKNEGTDNFSTQLKQEITFRLQAKADSTNETKSEDKHKTTTTEKFAGLTIEELDWISRGGTAVRAPELEGLFKKTPEAVTKFNLENLPQGADAKEWHQYLKSAEESLPALYQNQARSLLRNLQNLEELKDPSAIKELLNIKDIPMSEGIVEAYRSNFNEAISNLKKEAKKSSFDLKEYEFDNELHASLEAEANTFNTAALNSEDYQKFSKALNFLEGNGKYNPNKLNEDVNHVIEKLALADELKDKTPAEQKVFLTKVLNKIKNEQQELALATLPAGLDASTTDPAVFFDNFKDSVEYLYKHIEEKSENPEELRHLEQEMVRFMRSGDATDEANKEFVKRSPQLAKALNYFTRGRGDSQMNVGLVKSLFAYENGEGMAKVFCIRDIVAESSNMDTVASKIEEAIVEAGKNNNEAKIPEELFDQSVKAKTFHTFSLAAFEPEYTKDDKGKLTPTSDFTLFEKLGISAYMKNDEKHQIIIKDGTLSEFPKELKSLIQVAYAPKKMDDAEIAKLLTSKDGDIRRIADYDEKTGKVTFVDHGAVLMAVLKKEITDKEDKYLERVSSSYDAKQEMSLAQMTETRNQLIKLSEEHELGLFDKHKIPQAFHQTEYKEALENFATNADYLKKHVKANIAPFQTSSSSSYFGYPRTAANESNPNRASSLVEVASAPEKRQPHTSSQYLAMSEMDKQFEKIMDIIGADDSDEEDEENPDKDDLFRSMNDPFNTKNPFNIKRYGSLSINS